MKKGLNMIYNTFMSLIFLGIYNFVMLYISGKIRIRFFTGLEGQKQVIYSTLFLIASLLIILILGFFLSKEILKETYNIFTDILSVLLIPLAISQLIYFTFERTMEYLFMWFSFFVEEVISKTYLHTQFSLFVSIFLPLAVMILGLRIKRYKSKTVDVTTYINN